MAASLPADHTYKSSAPTSSVYHPNDFSNLKCWLIANNLTTGAVSSWTDASGNAKHATAGNQPTCVASAMNGHNVVRGDGVNDYLDIPAIRSSAGQVDIWVVSQRLSTCDNYPRLLSCYDGSGNDYDAPSWVVTPNWSSGGAGPNGSTYAARIDRVTSATTLGLYSTRLFASKTSVAQADSADIAEIVIYDATKSTIERAWISYYLANKYGISGYPPPIAGGGPINSQSLIRPADSKPFQSLIGG
jgi:hypothetical protein